MPSPLSIAIAEYNQRVRLGCRYATTHHGDWVVHRIDSTEVVLRSINEGYGYIILTRAELASGGPGLCGFRRLRGK